MRWWEPLTHRYGNPAAKLTRPQEPAEPKCARRGRTSRKAGRRRAKWREICSKHTEGGMKG